jgi:mono/diheme cytochrome c family protein
MLVQVGDEEDQGHPRNRREEGTGEEETGEEETGAEETGDETGAVACVDYNTDALAVINSRCSGCHTSGSSGGVNFSTHEGVTADKNGEPVYMRMIARAVETEGMPKGGPPLSDEDKDTLLSRAEQGAPESCD